MSWGVTYFLASDDNAGHYLDERQDGELTRWKIELGTDWAKDRIDIFIISIDELYWCFRSAWLVACDCISECWVPGDI